MLKKEETGILFSPAIQINTSQWLKSWFLILHYYKSHFIQFDVKSKKWLKQYHTQEIIQMSNNPTKNTFLVDIL